jgi:hypothetical protein
LHIPQVFLDGNVFGTYDAGAALSNMNFIAEYMSGIPGRKNLIWLATYFPIPMGPTGAMAGVPGAASAAPVAGSAKAGSGQLMIDYSYLLQDLIKRTYSSMMRTQMALYPVNVEGVGDPTNPHGGDSVSDYQHMDDVAAATGGHAFYANNHPHLLINKAIAHGESYYTLTYDPSNTKFDGLERNIQLTLANKDKHKDYRLTYRTLYYAVPDTDVEQQHKKEPLQARFMAAKTQDTLYANIEHGAPLLHDLLFSAQVAPEGGVQMATPEQMQALQDAPDYFKTRRKNKPQAAPKPIKLQKYVIDYGVIDPQLKAMAAHGQKAVLEFAAAAYNDDGRLLNSILNQGVPTGSGKKSQTLFHAIQELEAPPGTAYIRLAVRDTATNRTGTVEVKLPQHPDAVAPQAQAMGAAQ